jgi:hypothetical protein
MEGHQRSELITWVRFPDSANYHIFSYFSLFPFLSLSHCSSFFAQIDLPFAFRHKSDQIKSNQIRSNQIKSDQIESNRIKSNQVKSAQVRSSQRGNDDIINHWSCEE